MKPPAITSQRSQTTLRRRLRAWYERSKRDLPWRLTRDPYGIWISEIMLQQTRVAAVIPYYRKFLDRFPDVRSLARAREAELLECWSGLGYYSRARNLQKAAKEIDRNGCFPRDYESIRALPGIGDYTAAAVASIAFGLPYAVLDGNVVRVLARLSNEGGDVSSSSAKKRLQQLADRLLDRGDPGTFNQALMELGATLCLPGDPHCLLCPLLDLCEARRRGTERGLPLKRRKAASIREDKVLLIVERDGKLLLWRRGKQSSRMRGFWELPGPEQLPHAERGHEIARFRHTITNHTYFCTAFAAAIAEIPSGFRWVPKDGAGRIPLSTIARKALSKYL